MKPLYWVILVAAIVLVGGLVFGIAGIFLAPLLGIVAIIAILIWFGERKAQHKPPAE